MSLKSFCWLGDEALSTSYASVVISTAPDLFYLESMHFAGTGASATGTLTFDVWGVTPNGSEVLVIPETTIDYSLGLVDATSWSAPVKVDNAVPFSALTVRIKLSSTANVTEIWFSAR